MEIEYSLILSQLIFELLYEPRLSYYQDMTAKAHADKGRGIDMRILISPLYEPLDLGGSDLKVIIYPILLLKKYL